MSHSRRGQAPYGFRWKDENLHQEPHEARVRRLCFELFREHKSLGAVARELNRRGEKTRRDGTWSDMQVARLLGCRSAIGQYETNRSTIDDTGQRRSTPSQEREIIECEPIVNQDVWQTVQAVLTQKRQPQTEAITLAGLIVCSCGQKMASSEQGEVFRCAPCRRTITTIDIEAAFGEDFADLFADHPNWAAALGSSREELQLAADHAALEATRQTLLREREGIERMFLEKAITKARFETLHRPVEASLASLEKRLADLKARLPRPQQDVNQNDWLVRWQSLGPSRRRQFIRTLTEQIKIGADDIELTYLLPEPTAPKDDPEPQQISRPTNQHLAQRNDGGPVYIRLPKSGEQCPISGLSRAKLNELILPNARNNFRPPVASKSLRQPGQQRGVRLILLESLLAHLEQPETES